MEMAWIDVYDASEWVIRFAMLFYVPYRRDAAAARGWLLLIFFLPWAGLFLYALFGRAYLPRQRRARQQAVREAIDRIYRQLPAAVPFRERAPAQLWPALDLTGALSNFPVVGGNRFELIHDYHAALDRLIAGIDAARSHVHLMYYIYADDAVGRRVSDALVRARQRGVVVRVLMDAIGARDGLKVHAPALRAAGAEVIALLPLHLFRRERLRPDLRNHRKIVVIDGAVAFFGSQNIVSPTANKGLTNEEMVVRAEGAVVKQLHAVLLGDRYLETADLPPEVDVSEPCGSAAASARLRPGAAERAGLQYRYHGKRDGRPDVRGAVARGAHHAVLHPFAAIRQCNVQRGTARGQGAPDCRPGIEQALRPVCPGILLRHPARGRGAYSWLLRQLPARETDERGRKRGPDRLVQSRPAIVRTQRGSHRADL